MNPSTQYPLPATFDILGVARGTVTLTAQNGTPASVNYTRGEYFRYEATGRPTRLRLATAWPDSSRTAAYSNITVTATSGTTVSSSGRTFIPAKNEVYTHDVDGNLTADARWTYGWDAENQLTNMVSIALPNSPPLASTPGRVAYRYDFRGRRIQKLVYSSESSPNLILDERYLYDGWNLLAIVNGSGVLQKSFLWGPDMSGSLQGAGLPRHSFGGGEATAGGVGGLIGVSIHTGTVGIHTPVYDGNGNIVAMVSEQAGSVTVTANYEYGPFGETIRASGAIASLNPFRFSTKFQDNETDLLYYGYRFYSASTGRWLSRDSLEEQITEEGAIEPNLYGFVFNDPIRGYDFLGLKSRCNNDTDCMRCLLFHEGRGKNSTCLAALRDVIVNRAALNHRSICKEAQSGAYSGAKGSGSNYNKCCNQNWCADITKDANGNPIRPYNPDKEDESKIDDFVNNNNELKSSNGSIIRFHDKSISKPADWGDQFVEVPVPGCDSFTFYKKVPKQTKSKK